MRRLTSFVLLALFLGAGCKACKDDPGPGQRNDPDMGSDDMGDVGDEPDMPRMVGELVVESCDNGIDDDGDGLTDCEQRVCQLRDECAEVPAEVVAPALPETGFPNFADSVRFLWEGDGPVIRGLDPAALDESRVAVLRGRVLDTAGQPVSGVRASIVGQDRLGYTYSRADGAVDLVANGGSDVVVRWESADFPAVDRPVSAPRLAFAHAEPVVMTPYDEASTTVDLSAGGTHVATVRDDADGARAVRMYFQPGTLADIVLDDGDRTTLDAINVRATEFTVGDTGLDAMPAFLPETSAYTWAAELSVDEARAVGSTRVEFDKPVTVFLDNFLDVEVGMIVPNGLYNRDTARWEAVQNGIVAQRVGDGVDIDGDGSADSGAALEQRGFPAGAAGAVTELFEDGDTFWMAVVEHFTPCDLNFPYEFPDDALSPDDIPDFPTTEDTDPCETSGSIIECQNQVLGKSLPVPGTALRLNYRSDRVAGRGRAFEMNLIGSEGNPSLERVVVIVEIAGRRFEEELPAEPNLTYRFEWDGIDAYGREAVGEQFVRVTVQYWYEVQYTAPPDVAQAFAQDGDAIFREGRLLLPIQNRYVGRMGGIDGRQMFGLGGWQLSSQHAWDGGNRSLHVGSGPKRDAADVGRIIRNFDDFADDRDVFGFDIWDSSQTSPFLHANDDGTFIMVISVPQTGNARTVWRREVDGTWTHLAGGTAEGDTDAVRECLINDTCGDADAREATVSGLKAAVHPNGDVYMANGSCVWQVSGGAYEKAAGDCLPGEWVGEQDDFPHVNGIDVSPDGRVFVSWSYRIYEIFPGEKRIELIAGCNNCDEPATTGGPALDRDIGQASMIAATNEGVYFTGEQNDEIKFVDRSGRFSVVWTGDETSSVRALHAAPDGTLWFTDAEGLSGMFLKRLRADGSAETIAGAASEDILALGPDAVQEAYRADGIPATSAFLLGAFNFTVDRDGRIFFLSSGSIDDPDAPTTIPLVKVIESSFGDSIADDEVLVPSLRGTQLHKFDANGRILETRHALTGMPIYTYEYDADGRLSAVVDPDIGSITIERDASGQPTAIVSPTGLRTAVTLDAEGHIATVRYDDSTGVDIASSDGLITSWTDAAGFETTYQYDAMGRLGRMDDAAGGWKTLTATGAGVRLETSSGRSAEYGRVRNVGTGPNEQIVVDRHGLEWRTTHPAVLGTHTTTPDGTILERVVAGDPRLGIQAQYMARRSTLTPSGLEQVATRTREYAYSDPDDLRSVTSLTEVVTINDNASTEVWDVPSRTRTVTTATGRVFIETFDDQGRPLTRTSGSYTPVEYDWYDDGQLAEVRQGSRWMRWERDASGFVTALSTSGGETVTYQNDVMGRAVSATWGGQTWNLGYDDRSLLSSVDAPGGAPTVDMSWDSRNLVSSSAVPGAGVVTFEANVDKSPTQRTSPSGRVTQMQYDSLGRPLDIVLPERTISRTWDPATGLVSGFATDETSTEFTYDGFAATERRQTVGPADITITRELDDNFRVVSRRVGTVDVAYAFDADGFKTEAGGMTIIRGAVGEVTETSIGNIRHEVERDADGRTTAQRYFDGNTLLYSWAVTFDAGDRIASVVEQIEGVTTTIDYDRDALGRLQAVQRNTVETERYLWESEARRIDANGVPATFDVDGRLTAQGPLTVGYDGDGNVSALDDGVDNLALQHDSLGNLTSATDGLGATRFIYDGGSRLVGIERDGAFQRGWVYDDDDRPVGQVGATGTLEAVFVYATQPHVPDLVRKGGKNYRIVTDWRGSVRLVVDTTNGTIVQRRDFDEFGVQLAATAPEFQPFAYAGGLDLGLGSVWAFPSRIYAAEIGRWLEPDPTGLRGGTVDLWTYAMGDPVTFVDPRGEWVAVAIKVVAVALVLTLPAAGVHEYSQRNANQAIAAYEERYNCTKGRHNGPSDGIKHCTLTCENTRALGSDISMAFGDLNESELAYAIKGEENPEDEKHMDESNNHCGDHLAQEYPDEPCYALCEGAYFAGDLVVMPEGTWSGNWYCGG